MLIQHDRTVIIASLLHISAWKPRHQQRNGTHMQDTHELQYQLQQGSSRDTTRSASKVHARVHQRPFQLRTFKRRRFRNHHTRLNLPSSLPPTPGSLIRRLHSKQHLRREPDIPSWKHNDVSNGCWTLVPNLEETQPRNSCPQTSI